MSDLARIEPKQQDPAGLGRRMAAAAFTTLDLYANDDDGAILITSGAIAAMAPTTFEAATGLVGAGGVIGLRGAGAACEPWRLLCVTQVEARMLSHEMMEEEAAAGRRFQAAEMRTLAGLHRTAQRTAVCVLRHPVQQRIAAWLLALREGAGGDELRIAQAGLARLAGAQRTTVTAAVSVLARAGAVRVGRNRLMITDPARLAAQSCGCMKCGG